MVAVYMVQFSGEEGTCSKYAEEWLKPSTLNFTQNML